MYIGGVRVQVTGDLMIATNDGRIAFRRRWIDIGDASGDRMAAIEFGSSEMPVEVVFAHANGLNALSYRHVLAPLATRTRLVAFDHRGHGRTTLPALPPKRSDWSDLTGDLVALLDRIAEKPVLLVGHSMGGATALLASLQRPALVRGVLLLDPVIHSALPPWRKPPPIAAAALRRRVNFPSRSAAVQAYIGRGAFKTWPLPCLEDYASDGFRDLSDESVELSCSPDWEASSFMATAHDDWKELTRVNRPVRILRAEEGSVTYLPNEIGRLIEVTTVTGTTHFLPFERPDMVRSEIISFLESTQLQLSCTD
jgi:pimeloyl-ACP methyl ester carboxylesterase